MGTCTADRKERAAGRAVVSSLFSLEAAMKLEENLNIRI